MKKQAEQMATEWARELAMDSAHIPMIAQQLTKDGKLEQLLAWKEEDPRMLREQLRVADEAFQNLQTRFEALEEQNEEYRNRMVEFVESPAGDLFTARQKIQTGDRVIAEQKEEIRRLETDAAIMVKRLKFSREDYRRIFPNAKTTPFDEALETKTAKWLEE